MLEGDSSERFFSLILFFDISNVSFIEVTLFSFVWKIPRFTTPPSGRVSESLYPIVAQFDFS